MFDPQKVEAVASWSDADLLSLPPAEDQLHEFKSSLTNDTALAAKLAEAASGFWNAGGGLFVAGVDNQGKADGGIPDTVGRQDRRDWVDQSIHRVAPVGKYEVGVIRASTAGANIGTGSCVVVVGFANSRMAPHMAPDNRYYVRAGAHTAPASHFVVESLRARRAMEDPILSVIARTSPDSSRIGQIVVAALTSAPALQVKVRFDQPPPLLARGKAPTTELERAFIDRSTPLVVDATYLSHQPRQWVGAGTKYQLEVTYSDLAGNSYSTSSEVDMATALGPPPIDDSPVERIALHLAHIENHLNMISKKK